MGQNSKIEWCDHTFNAWIGCTKVGPPCDNCYAEGMANRYGWVTWGPHCERKRTSEANWKLPLRWAKASRNSIMDRRPRVFCCSLADWLDNQAPQEWRVDLANLIAATPELDWLLLTKRIQNFRKLSPWGSSIPFPSNVWLGITCGDQSEYDRDWPTLREIPASVRFVSYEPALGPLGNLSIDGLASINGRPRTPDWIIAGGESGPKARMAQPAWFRNLRDECIDLGIAFFFKQWGEFSPNVMGINDSYPPSRIGKKAAGRVLDFREHSEFPVPRIA